MGFYGCDACDKTFERRSNLNAHISRIHENVKFKCNACRFITNTKFSLKRHVQSKHTDREGSRRRKTYPKCCLCNETRSSKEDILDHYTTQHDIVIQNETLSFENEEEFFNWKRKTEKEQVCEFVISRTRYVSKVDGSAKMTFICYRDGDVRLQGNNIRKLKKAGSNKINGHCPAKLQVTFLPNENVTVQYCKTHVGHTADLGRMRLSKSERDDIARQIALKIPFNEILDSVRLSSGNQELERKALLSRKDLLNIEQTYKLKSEATRHSKDPVSLESWILKMKDSDGLVHFYKPQGTALENYSQFQADDFVLIIMNDAQKEMLQLYGQHCICFDRTRGLNSYGFELITLLVLDELNQGFPCAFMLSNRGDSTTLEMFVTVILDAVAFPIHTRVFMSDMAEVFYNAWAKLMPPPQFRLFCSWHVDCAWRENLPKIKGQEKQAETYKLLRTLLEERDETAFVGMFTEVIDLLKNDPERRDFGAYFEKEYKDSVKSWAHCYHLHAGLNTNMHLERMHDVLKHISMRGKNPKRLDLTLHTLMRFVKDRLIYLNKGNLTNKISALRRRHKESLELSIEELVFEENTWKMKSSSRNEIYEIRQTDAQCECDLRCTECEMCIHAYSCSCPDSAIKFNMCKHIHAVQRKVNEISSEQNSDTECHLIVEELPNSHEPDTILHELDCRQHTENMEQRKAKLRQQFENILGNYDSDEDFEIINQMLASILQTLEARKLKRAFPSESQQSCSKALKFGHQQQQIPTKVAEKKSSASTASNPSDEQEAVAALSLLYQ